MYSKDPNSVTCPNCSEVSEQRVDDLMDLSAVCSACGQRLTKVGQEMRSVCMKHDSVWLLLNLVVAIERKLDIEITDAKLMQVATLNDLCGVVQSRLPMGTNSEEQAVQLVMNAVNKLPVKVPSKIPFDVPLLQAIDPERWSEYGSITMEHAILHYLYE